MKVIPFQQADFDENLFINDKSSQFNELIFTDREIDRAIEFLTQFTDSRPVSKLAIILLLATSNFRAATTQEPMFRELRENARTKEEFEEILMKTREAFQNAKMSLDHLKKEDQHFLESVISYCKQSIWSQVQAMKAHHDELYTIFSSQLDDLTF